MIKPRIQFLITLLLFVTGSGEMLLMGQSITQLTNDESQFYDSNYEFPINLDGLPHYASYIDDKVVVTWIHK